ncbi:MAG: HAMP domain-containing histidine kinase [Polyangiaceae bacterium]|nr:HAMP domain-containing histidine kinase [Myxococcales bacterium]MCB9589400.1 HAMP domain-containing histidine kinase [Polyangiaceae bacterium]
MNTTEAAPQALHGTPAADAFRINLSWLVRMRWFAMFGQAVVITGVTWFMGVELPLLPVGVILALELTSNLGYVGWLRQEPEVSERMLVALVAFDLLLFTLLLYFSGGPQNPFSFLYLIHIAVAALVVRPKWTWGLVLLALFCSGALFFENVPLHMAGSDGIPFKAHLYGIWVALGVGATFIVYFMQRVNAALRSREAELAAAEQRTRRSDQLASLATLAAGAAHELSTPLSTIAVIVKELDRELGQAGVDDRLLGDLRLIREQVERCREILIQLSSDSGTTHAENQSRLELPLLVKRALENLQETQRVDVVLSDDAQSYAARVPERALVRALRGLIKNALDASSGQKRVKVEVAVLATGWRFEVVDRGTGMSEEVLRRAVEPFFTTKEPGRGMGLGLFLTRAVVEGLGGQLLIQSQPGEGTRATVLLPHSEDSANKATQASE